MMCWHKWTKWQEQRSTIYKKFHWDKYQGDVVKIVQRKECTKCGKMKVRTIETEA